LEEFSAQEIPLKKIPATNNHALNGTNGQDGADAVCHVVLEAKSVHVNVISMMKKEYSVLVKVLNLRCA